MKFLERFIDFVKTSLLNSYTTLGVAELLQYDWDGVFSRKHWHGWLEFFGTPYSISVNGGATAAGVGGWIDVRHVARISVTCFVTGAAGGAAGRVDFIWQSAYDLINEDLQWFADNLRMDVMADGTNIVSETEVLDVDHMSYIRLHSLTNSGAVAVTCQARTMDGIRPVVI